MVIPTSRTMTATPIRTPALAACQGLGNPCQVSTQISTTSSAWNQTSGMMLCSICTW
jgi:hypothetical protein